MTWQTKCLTCLIVTLSGILFPSSALAWSFALSPPEIEIDNLSPGEVTEFNFTIHNKDDISHVFILTAHNPEETQLRQGRNELPDSKWVSFPPQVEVQADSKLEVPVKVAIPPEKKWSDKNWEIWLGVKPEDNNLLLVNYYIRILVSTSKGTKSGLHTGLILGITAAVVLVSYCIYYYRRKVKYS